MSRANKAAGALWNARLSADLAERENRLQDLIRKLITAQEEERRKVSYEVHDGLAQTATGAHQHALRQARLQCQLAEAESGERRQLGRRGRAVGVDERHEVGVATPERLHQHAALAELGELVEDDAAVLGGLGADDVGRVVHAAVEGHEEAHVLLGEATAVGPQGAGDAVFLVVGRDAHRDDVVALGRHEIAQGHVAVVPRRDRRDRSARRFDRKERSGHRQQSFRQNGLVTGTLLQWGIIDRPLVLLDNKNRVMPTLIMVNVWKEFPFVMVMLTAGLQTVPEGLLRAARVGGSDQTRSGSGEDGRGEQRPR